MSALSSKFKTYNIKDGNNIECLLGSETIEISEKDMFTNQQQILEIAIHACDLSPSTRAFPIVREWIYLLFAEFFRQGDLEKEKGFPITFLCDRNATNIAKAQPGFCNFVCIPMFNEISNVMPLCAPLIAQLK